MHKKRDVLQVAEEPNQQGYPFFISIYEASAFAISLVQLAVIHAASNASEYIE